MKGYGDMAKEQNTPSHVNLELALLALQTAMSGIRLIEQNDITSEFRGRLPAVLDELSKATYFLNKLKTPSKPMAIHGFN